MLFAGDSASSGAVDLVKNSFCKDLCSRFDSYKAFEKSGLGFCIIHEGEIVSEASSYTVYDGGIEIEIDTKVAYRQKGLASACAAKLILACLRKGLYPSWDAHNQISLALAEKLGYVLDYDYTSYEIDLE